MAEKTACECLDVVRAMLITDAKFLAKRGFRSVALGHLEDVAKLDDKAQAINCFDLRELASRRRTLETWKKLIEAGARF